MGGLLQLSTLEKGFIFKSFNLLKGESITIKTNGLFVLCSGYYNLYSAVALLSPTSKKIEYIAGNKEYVDGILFDFQFNDDRSTTLISKIQGIESNRVPFFIAYQSLL